LSTNAFVDTCSHCGENTCLNNVSTKPQYHNKECWSCGYELLEGEVNWMTEKERLDLKADMEEVIA
jgi:predicted sulfurtransferase